MAATLTNEFTTAAKSVASLRLHAIRSMCFEDVLKLPEVAIEDIVVTGKEVQLAVFRQRGVPDHPEAALITVQITRAGMRGLINFQFEKGLVFLPTGVSREATEVELKATGS